MKRAEKEKRLVIVGLGMALAGGVWFGLAAASNLLQGMAELLGLFFGAALVVVGLLMALVYLLRWRRIRSLIGGKNLLAQWRDGGSEVFIAPDCGYIDGELHLWSGSGARLEQATLVEAVEKLQEVIGGPLFRPRTYRALAIVLIAAAQDWVATTLPTLAKAGDAAETHIGGVRFRFDFLGLVIRLNIGELQ